MTTISFQLPDHIERQLHAELGDLSSAAKEAALIELYRQGQLSHGKLAEGLEISRYETDAILKRHKVIEDLVTPEELDEQIRNLRISVGP